MIAPIVQLTSSRSVPDATPAPTLPVMTILDVAGFPPQDQILLNALKTYGIILADNGSAWFISGAPDDRWNNENLSLLVMGGYGHSRLKETVFGGVTRDMLRSMTVPTLMSH